MADAKTNKAQLVAEIGAFSEEIAEEFQGAMPLLAHVHLSPGVRCPEPGDIPVAVLRRLHGALTEFIAEALAAESAKLPRRDA